MPQAFGFVCEMNDKGFKPNVIIFSNVIEALKLSDDMLQAGLKMNVITYTCLLDGLCEAGKMKDAEVVFKEALQNGITPNLGTYTALVHGHIKVDKMENDMQLLKEMKEKRH
ncbi:hypothetical protein ACFE04_003131 [Oxalis oulophora]